MDKPILERIKQRVREHGQTYKINQLCLDELPIGQITPDMTRVLEKCLNLQYITLEDCSLKSLANFPKLPKLETIQIANNQIQGSSLAVLSKYSNLRNLNLQNNKLISIDQLKCLQSCKQLAKIYLQGNPFCGQQYRNQVFFILPQLQNIDGYNRNGQAIAESSSSEGSSEYSDSQIQESQPEERDSPTKMKRKY